MDGMDDIHWMDTILEKRGGGGLVERERERCEGRSGRLIDR